jgi:hypothetical protein
MWEMHVPLSFLFDQHSQEWIMLLSLAKDAAFRLSRHSPE